MLRGLLDQRLAVLQMADRQFAGLASGGQNAGGFAKETLVQQFGQDGQDFLTRRLAHRFQRTGPACSDSVSAPFEVTISCWSNSRWK